MTFPVNSFDCNQCHSTTAWSPNTFKHRVGGGYPGDHRVTLTCRSCHTTNTDAATWRTPAYKPNCAGCHSNKYKTDPHTKYGNVKYTVSELRNCSGACHTYTDSTLTKISEEPGRPGTSHDGLGFRLMRAQVPHPAARGRRPVQPGGDTAVGAGPHRRGRRGERATGLRVRHAAVQLHDALHVAHAGHRRRNAAGSLLGGPGLRPDSWLGTVAPAGRRGGIRALGRRGAPVRLGGAGHGSAGRRPRRSC